MKETLQHFFNSPLPVLPQNKINTIISRAAAGVEIDLPECGGSLVICTLFTQACDVPSVGMGKWGSEGSVMEQEVLSSPASSITLHLPGIRYHTSPATNMMQTIEYRTGFAP